jgi:hypothetical protein
MSCGEPSISFVFLLRSSYSFLVSFYPLPGGHHTVFLFLFTPYLIILDFSDQMSELSRFGCSLNLLAQLDAVVGVVALVTVKIAILVHVLVDR